MIIILLSLLPDLLLIHQDNNNQNSNNHYNNHHHSSHNSHSNSTMNPKYLRICPSLSHHLPLSIRSMNSRHSSGNHRRSHNIHLHRLHTNLYNHLLTLPVMLHLIMLNWLHNHLPYLHNLPLCGVVLMISFSSLGIQEIIMFLYEGPCLVRPKMQLLLMS